MKKLSLVSFSYCSNKLLSFQICRNGCDKPFCEGNLTVEGPKKTTSKIATMSKSIKMSPLTQFYQTTPALPISRGAIKLQELTTRGTPITQTPAVSKGPQRNRVQQTREFQVKGTTPVKPQSQFSSLGPLQCYQDSDDPRCLKDQAFEATTRTELIRNRPTRPVTRKEITVKVEQETIENLVVTTYAPKTRQPIQTTRQLIQATSFSCTLESSDSRCQIDCNPGSTDTRCTQTTTQRSIQTTISPIQTTVFACTAGNQDPRCKSDCYPGSTDRRCSQITTQRSIQTTPRPIQTTVFACTAGSQDPRCKPDCYPGTTDRRCSQTTTQRSIQRQTTQPPTYLPPETTTRFSCTPTSTDPRCPANCYTGSTDKRCNDVSQRPVQTTPRPIQTTVFACTAGSQDPRCKPDCYPGTTDRRCSQSTTQRSIQTTPRSIQTTPRSILTTPRSIQTTPRFIYTTVFACTRGSQDPRCKPDCYPGTTDRRCPQSTTQRSIQTTPRPIQTTVFTCIPGSRDSRCKPDCFPGSSDSRCPRPFSSTSKPSTINSACYPGSPNPNCPQPYRPSSTNPPVTYLPPLDSSSVRRLRQVDQVLIEDINNLIQPGASDFHEITSSLADIKTEAIHNSQSKLRQKREINGEKEIISITLNFKGYKFS